MSVTIGTAIRHGRQQPVELSYADRRHHLYTIGQTGTGKTTFLRNAIVQDIARGKGVAVLDPHGDLAESLLDAIPASRVADTIYFDPADTEYPIAVNPIEKAPPELHHLIISQTVAALRGIWRDTWGMGRMQYVLTNTLAALLYYEHSSFLAVNRFLSDARFRTKVLARVPDPVIRSFWQYEFAAWDKHLQAEAAAPIQNKVGQFAATTVLRNIVGQPRNAVDFRRLMDRGQIFIANLSKGRMGEEGSRLLGSFLVAQLQLAALSRADVREEERPDFYLYIDEFQNFTNHDALESILSEARKYHLALALAHQYTAQIKDLAAAVFGNVGTILSLRVGADDSRELVHQFHPLDHHALTDLDPHTGYLKMLSGGAVSDPLFVNLLPPVPLSYGRAESVRALSRRRFGTARGKVEERIGRWLTH